MNPYYPKNERTISFLNKKHIFGNLPDVDKVTGIIFVPLLDS